jgi:pSer/pThr/pTyr-binding forkhead associated (FHA) protein
MFIGRTPDNDLQIDNRYVSRHHAQVVTTAEGSSIEDLNSTNGMFVRGRRVRRHRLQEGDAVEIGMHEITYHRADAYAATAVLANGDERIDEEDEEAAEAEEEGDG